MRLRILGLTFLLLASAPAAEAWQGAAPAYPPPPTPACRDVIDQYGERGLWMGHFSGRRYAGGHHGTAVYGRLGCFRSEAECRSWLAHNMAFAAMSTITACRPLGATVR
jgi:hypothetical protein